MSLRGERRAWVRRIDLGCSCDEEEVTGRGLAGSLHRLGGLNSDEIGGSLAAISNLWDCSKNACFAAVLFVNLGRF